MGVLTKAGQYFCIDKLTLDKKTMCVFAEVKVYNSQEDREKSPLTVFSHNCVLQTEVWAKYFGERLASENPYKLAYGYLKTIDKAFTSGTDV
jgi:hypothetical protein